MCLYVGTCTLVKVLMEATGVGSPSAGVTSGGEQPDTGLGNQTDAVHEQSMLWITEQALHP